MKKKKLKTNEKERAEVEKQDCNHYPMEQDVP